MNSIERFTTRMGGPADIDRADHVVLLDMHGRPSGTMPKSLVHHEATPLHLAFSCHVVAPDGRALITRRSPDKRTWPGVWSNACCGHPRLGETLREAVGRHLRRELGCRLGRVAVAISDFAYRAEMPNGLVEHELCPVVVAEIEGPIQLDPTEVADTEWVEWAALRQRARDRPDSLSPWVVAQLGRLPPSPDDVLGLLDRHDTQGTLVSLLDVRITLDLDGPTPVVPARTNRTAGTGDRSRLESVVEPVDDVLSSFLAERQRELTAVDDAAACLGRAVADLVTSGGKRLRPAFVYWGWRAARGADAAPLGDGDHAAHVLGAAMELLHTFALLHDDVMDRADVRRGRPTARTTFAAAHRGRGGHGDPELFGASTATLAGDLAFVWADQLLDSIDATAARGRAMRAVFHRLRTEVIAGQYLDLLAGSTPFGSGAHPNEEAATAVARLKSARYTVTRPLELGAALGGPLDTSSPTARALARYGDAIGLAFQMRDDVIDLFGDPASTGKRPWGDLREGKRTVLIERTLRLAGAADVELLTGWLGDPELSDADAERCRDIVAGSGALASVEAMIADLHGTALDALDGIDQVDVCVALDVLAGLAVAREW